MLRAMTTFEKIAGLGYTDLVPIVPPGVPVSATSSLAKRVGTRADARGKVPGIKGRNGEWYSFDWVPYQADADDLRRWADMGAGVGIKTGGGLLAIDADTLDEDCARIIRDAVRQHFGQTPIRVGRYPKALYLIRTTEPAPYARILFGQPDTEGKRPHLCEFLTERRQFVAEGVHPVTNQPYSWPSPLIPADELVTVTPEQLAAFQRDLQSLLPDTAPLSAEGAGGATNQEALRGDPAMVRKAVAATPNTSAKYPSRGDYLAMGYAIKAAIEDDAEAFETFSEWCDKWQDGSNDPDIVEADWRRMKGPFKRGAGWLYQQAEEAGFDTAQVFFDPIVSAPASPFDTQAETAKAEEDTETFPILSIGDLLNRPPPTYLIDRHIPDVSVGFLYADPGAGKSFLAMDIGLHIAHGRDTWHGDPIALPEANSAPVAIYLAAEGAFDLRNRILAWHKAHDLPITNNFLVIEQPMNFMQADDIRKLIRSIRGTGRKPAFVVVDTVSRMLPGADENSQKDMTLFVKACDAVRDAFRCAVLGVHHAGKSGDLRGSTVLRGAGDYVMRLDRKRGATIGTLTMEKQKSAEDGWSYQMELRKTKLDDGQSSLVPFRLEGGAVGGDAGAAAAPLVLEAMRRAWDAGQPWTMASNVRDRERHAVRRMVADFGYKGDAAEEVLRVWAAAGMIETALRDSKTHIKGLRVCATYASHFDGAAEREGGQYGVFQ